MLLALKSKASISARAVSESFDGQIHPGLLYGEHMRIVIPKATLKRDRILSVTRRAAAITVFLPIVSSRKSTVEKKTGAKAAGESNRCSMKMIVLRFGPSFTSEHTGSDSLIHTHTFNNVSSLWKNITDSSTLIQTVNQPLKDQTSSSDFTHSLSPPHTH